MSLKPIKPYPDTEYMRQEDLPSETPPEKPQKVEIVVPWWFWWVFAAILGALLAR